MTQALTVLVPHDLASWGDRKLENAIQRGHAAAGVHMRGYDEAAALTGLLLLERKRRLKHGEWLPWLAGHFDGAQRTAYRYIEMAEQRFANLSSTTTVESPTGELEAAELVVDDGDEPEAELDDGGEIVVDDAEVVDFETADAESGLNGAGLGGRRRPTSVSQAIAAYDNAWGEFQAHYDAERLPAARAALQRAEALLRKINALIGG